MRGSEGGIRQDSPYKVTYTAGGPRCLHITMAGETDHLQRCDPVRRIRDKGQREGACDRTPDATVAFAHLLMCHVWSGEWNRHPLIVLIIVPPTTLGTAIGVAP